MTPHDTTTSRRILLIGDTHGNSRWLNNVVFPAAEQLQVDTLCQLGDFGYWPDSREFLDLARNSPLPFFFIDGNHEHHDLLDADVAQARRSHDLEDTDPVPMGGNLWFLPRGGRTTWGGVNIAALGGARSIDRKLRTPGYDWFTQEAISVADLDRLAANGRCDVLLTHDTPASVNLPLNRQGFPRSWIDELPACEEHRTIIDAAIDTVQPRWLIHGHYHKRWQLHSARPWGGTTVIGLSEDGSDIVDNVALLICNDGNADVRNVKLRHPDDPTLPLHLP